MTMTIYLDLYEARERELRQQAERARLLAALKESRLADDVERHGGRGRLGRAWRTLAQTRRRLEPGSTRHQDA